MTAFLYKRLASTLFLIRVVSCVLSIGMHGAFVAKLMFSQIAIHHELISAAVHFLPTK
jgi:hypothetical protein